MKAGRHTIREMDSLIGNVDPKAKLPRGFVLWSAKMQLMWLRQNQRPSMVRKEK